MAEITIPGMFLTGDHASRPAATAVGDGSLYACSDHTKVYQSDGASWSDWYAAASTGSVGNTLSSTLVTASANQNVAGSGTATPVSFDAEVADDSGAWAIGTPTKIVIPAGLNGRKARLYGQVLWVASTGGSYRMLEINKNAGTLLGSFKIPDAASAVSVVSQVQSRVITLATGDEFTLDITADATGQLVIGSAVYNFFGLYTVD